MADRSPLYELVTARLGRDAAEWLAERRAAGRSWDAVALELYEATGRERWVTAEALRLWARP